ncbi:uncharacterized protein Dana_GF14989 [Drosophila ananassae]|uniref:ACB domain-containing protein n=1 Tax=Drosophila ananassae TaxID=7217 RepID=B3MLB2_DROAN|nr:acyl-CoA-binding domain-containing protein 5 [Drosophila ananassae]EDV30701.1 uncharacterized protein Dana_GF14989 [Drosophila ananassae]
MAAAIEQRFQAAVNVIKGLPKNGPYQPSTSMMLKFYGLFKQATEGACDQKKPGFWDVVGRAKWDAWHDNRHLNKEQAMQRYVESLKEIIETMSFTENVQNFVGSLDGLGNINLDELELVSPGMREIAESHPNSPFHSRTNSPQHGFNGNADEELEAPLAASETMKESDRNEAVITNGHIAAPLTNGYVGKHSNYAHDPHNYTNNSSVAIVEPSDDEYDDPYDLSHELTQAIAQNTELLQQIQTAISRMNSDVGTVQQRVRSLEQSVKELPSGPSSKRGAWKSSQPSWWPFTNISPLWFAILILWPFVVRRFAGLLQAAPQRRR